MQKCKRISKGFGVLEESIIETGYSPSLPKSKKISDINVREIMK